MQGFHSLGFLFPWSAVAKADEGHHVGDLQHVAGQTEQQSVMTELIRWRELNNFTPSTNSLTQLTSPYFHLYIPHSLVLYFNELHFGMKCM